MIKNKINLQAVAPGNIREQRKKINLLYPQRGSAEVVLTTYGEYLLIVNSYSISENQVKRTAEYKQAIYEVSSSMAAAFKSEDMAYCHLEKKAIKIKTKEIYEAEIRNMKPQKYARRSFNILKPTKQEVRELLNKEAESVFFGKAKDTKAIDKFVNSKCATLFADRYKAWEDAKALFDEIENAQAIKTNNEYQSQFEILRTGKLDFLAGDEQVVSDALSALETKIVSPYKISLDTVYSQNTCTLDVEAHIPQNLPISTEKVNLLQSGKVSIKAKLIKEQEDAKTDALLGVSFFLCSYLFDVSPNIKYINFMLTDAVQQNAYYWVRFERTAFARSVQSGNIYPPVDLYQYENILSMKDVRGALIILSQSLPDMRIAAKVKIANIIRNN